MNTSALLALIAIGISLIGLGFIFFQIFAICRNNKRLKVFAFPTINDVRVGKTYKIKIPKHLREKLSIHIKTMEDIKQESKDFGFMLDEDELLKKRAPKTKSKTT